MVSSSCSVFKMLRQKEKDGPYKKDGGTNFFKEPKLAYNWVIAVIEIVSLHPLRSVITVFGNVRRQQTFVKLHCNMAAQVII